MLTKMIFAIIDCLAVFDLYFTIKAMKQIKEKYGLQLRRAMSIAIVAIFAKHTTFCPGKKGSAPFLFL